MEIVAGTAGTPAEQQEHMMIFDEFDKKNCT